MKTHLFAGAIALALGACTQAPTPFPDVTSQTAVTNRAVASSIKHSDPLAGFVPRGPTGPRDWRTVNQEQAEGN